MRIHPPPPEVLRALSSFRRALTSNPHSQYSTVVDIGVAGLIQGAGVDRPRDATTMTGGLRQQAFGEFRIYFEPAAGDAAPHTYTRSARSIRGGS